MKPAEMDELLIRLDERTGNIYKLTEKQEQHLSELNEKVVKNQTNIQMACQRIDTMQESISNGLGFKLTKKQTAVGGTGIVSVIVLVLTALGKALGWW